MVWLIPAFVMRKSVKLALCSLTTIFILDEDSAGDNFIFSHDNL
jgi:hypothetical protein